MGAGGEGEGEQGRGSRRAGVSKQETRVEGAGDQGRGSGRAMGREGTKGCVSN